MIKLVDFGLLKLGDGTTSASRKAFSQPYSPPEQFGGTNEHTTTRSDIYSLAATLYHLLTGSTPSEAKRYDILNTIHDQFSPPPPPHQLNPEISEQVSDALMKALSQRQQDRFENAREFKHALVGSTTLLPKPIPEPEPPQQAERPQQTKWSRLLTLITLLVVILAVGFAISSWLTQEPSSASAYVERGDSYQEQGKHEEAIADYTKAIELDPNYTVAYKNRGWIYYLQENYEQAIADYAKVIELDDRNSLAYNNRGYIYSNPT